MKNILIFGLFFILATSTLARPFLDVTQAMLTVVPLTEDELRRDLQGLIQMYKILNKLPIHDLIQFSDIEIKKLQNIVKRAPEQRELELWKELGVYLELYCCDPNIPNQWRKILGEIYLEMTDYQKYLPKDLQL